MLEHLHEDAPSLNAAVRVSRAWFAGGTDILWRRPNSHAFACVAPPRRQFYADKVTVLREIPDALLEGALQLPRLRQLHLWRLGEYPLWPAEYARMLQLVQPALEELHCDMTLALAQRLAAQRMARLRSLHICAFAMEHQQATVDSLIAWLARRPLLPLRTVALPTFPHTDFGLTDRAFGLFAQWPGLVELRFAAGLPYLATATVFGAQAAFGEAQGCRRPSSSSSSSSSPRRPFEQLRCLELPLFAEAVPALADMLRCVTDLTLHTFGDEPVLPAVAAMTQLRSLAVYFGRRSPQCRLLELQKLTELRALALTGGSVYDGYCADLVDLLGALSELEVLRLPFSNAIDPMLLVQIGRLCPRLQTLDLYNARASLAAVVDSDSRRVLFPNLQQLFIGRLDGPSAEAGWVPTSSCERHDLKKERCM